jgi:hypothetical protein
MVLGPKSLSVLFQNPFSQDIIRLTVQKEELNQVNRVVFKDDK